MASVFYWNVDEQWSKFKKEMSTLLEMAYQLPKDLQVKAATEMEVILFRWKKSLEHNQPVTDKEHLQPPMNVSPDNTNSSPHAVVAAGSEKLNNEQHSSSALSNEPISNESTDNMPFNDKPINSEPLADHFPEVNFAEYKPIAYNDSGDEELVIAIADVPLVDNCSSDNDVALSENTVVSSASPSGTTSPPFQKAVKRKCSPRKCKSNSRHCTREIQGRDREIKAEQGEEVGRDTAKPRKRGRPRKGGQMLSTAKPTGSSCTARKQAWRKIAPKPVVKLESDEAATAAIDTSIRRRGRPKKCSSDTWKMWTHKCPTCGKLMATKNSLVAHIRIHTGEKPYQCEECGKSFSQISGLSVHRKRHRGSKDYHCQYCDFAAIQSIDISRHEMRHHTKEKPYLCDMCGRGFIDVWSLKNHINTHSKHKKDYACDKCDFKTHSPDILRAHTRNMHQVNRKTFTCPICDLVLRYQDTFSGHMRRHYGEKPFACKVCEASFASNSQLAAHKRIHQERLFACTKCNKKFINPHKLRRHEVVHTGAKEFQCPVCTYVCNVKSNLKKHCTAVHKIEYPPADMKRIKIVPIGAKDTLNAAPLVTVAGSTAAGETTPTTDSGHTPCKAINDENVHYLDHSKATSSIDMTGHVFDQQQLASKLHTGNSNLITDSNDAGNFLLFINECGTSSNQQNTPRSNFPVQQTLVVMPATQQAAEQMSGIVESMEGQACGEDVCELRFEQV